MLGFFKRSDTDSSPKSRPLSRQIMYGGNPSLFNQQNGFASQLLQHLSFAQYTSTNCTLQTGTQFIGFSKKTSGTVLVFPISVQKDTTTWHKLVQFAQQQQLTIGVLALTQAVSSKKMTSNGRDIYVINSPADLKPCARLYPKANAETPAPEPTALTP